MTIAIFSGSFDPIHCGHAMMANYLAQFSDVDEVWLMPSRLNPLKTDTPPASFADRMKMCRIVADKCSGVKVSDFELRLPSPSYTYDTLSELKNKFPQHCFKLLIGSDNWVLFDKWRNHQKIISEFGLVVYPRPGYEVASPLPSNVTVLDEAPIALISSTFIREALRQEKNLNFLIDVDVYGYIKQNSLYDT